MGSDVFGALPETLFAISVSGSGDVELQFSLLGLALLAAVGTLFWILAKRRFGPLARVRDFEINEATIGLGDHRLKLKPNDTDRQIAYAIWVELSTRKLGLPIDPDHDVIHEIYDSWYTFFGLTRGLMKDLPVHKIRHSDTLDVVDLALRVLNDAMRPHLTQWQARYRHWYDAAKGEYPDLTPQKLQRRFPEAEAQMADLLRVNAQLMAFRSSMYALAIES